MLFRSIDFEKKRLSQNPNVKASNIKIFYKKELEAKGWYGYILDFDAVIQDKNMKVKDTLFSDGKVVATDLFDITTSKSLKSTIVPNITDKYYQKSKLVAGSEKAKDKIVIFSDPLCPFCAQYVPEVIEFVNKNDLWLVDEWTHLGLCIVICLENTKLIDSYLKGNLKVLDALMGKVIRLSNMTVDPELIKELLPLVIAVHFS